MQRPVTLACLIFAAACGGADLGRSQPAGGDEARDPCAAGVGLDLLPIEDFETGHAVYWWVSNDQSRGSTMTPPAGNESPTATEIPFGRCGVSRRGLEVTATGLNDWGGSFGYYFFPGPINAASWTGLSFWARRGPTSAGRSLFVSLADKYTDEQNGRKLFADGQPFCLEQPIDAAQKCDRFTTGVGVEEEWRFFTIPFSRFAQRGIGKAAPALDRPALLGLDLSFATGDWELWVDDVALYR